MKVVIFLSVLLSLTQISFATNLASSDLDFLLKKSKEVEIHLLDLPEEKSDNKMENNTISDEISLSMAAPVRENVISPNKKLNIKDAPVNSVRLLRKRGR